MSASQSNNPNVRVIGTARCVGWALNHSTYAIIGGAAVALLGGSRQTEDVDVVVPAGAVSAARSIFAQKSEYFSVDPRTRHTYCKTTPPTEVQLLSPPTLFRESFDETTVTMELSVEGQKIRILHPLLLLNAKCNSVLSRSNDTKKASDANDITFLLRYLADNNLFDWSRVPNAGQDFIAYFISVYGGQQYWEAVGFTTQGTT